MSSISRALQLAKNNEELAELFNDIDNQFHDYHLGANTPILNKQLPVEKNSFNKPTTLFLSENASQTLKSLREISQKKTVYRFEQNKKDIPLEFFCLGYLDFDGDIVIENINFPAYTYASHNANTNTEIYNKIFNNKINNFTNIEGFGSYFDYLRETNFNIKNSQGKCPVALYGITRPVSEYSDGTENCIRLGELAKSIAPGDIKFGEIITGVLSVSPYTFSQSPEGLKKKDGSLEAIITKYAISNKNGFLTPVSLTNITKCSTPSHEIEISKSPMPKLNIKNHTHSNIR